MGFIWQRSSIAIAVVIVLFGGAIALASTATRSHRTHVGNGLAMRPALMSCHLQPPLRWSS